KKVKQINIGCIAPLSLRATDLGVGPSNAMLLAVEEYNNNRLEDEPKVNLFIEDDKWDKNNAIPAYNKLRDEHNIDILFISNTDGTVAVQEKIIEDNVILINPLNNDELLSSLNQNTFKIAKSTEQANGLIAIRIIELGYKKVAIFHYPNDYMERGANEVKRLLDNAKIDLSILPVEVGETTFIDQLNKLKEERYDAYVFFGYKEFGFAMKEARDMGITAPFFGSTVLLDPDYFSNSEGAIIDTEYPFFTLGDGNYILASEFLLNYDKKFGKHPDSMWPPMQAYDAMNLVLSQLRTINKNNDRSIPFDEWLRNALHRVNYYQGVCGNIAIKENGASKGIYFALYNYESKENPIVKVKR
ncbi:MAG: ABC transporter substrate-binding protein, partial [Bizionia sp.]|nr:ABC transporter substrate-binding protein [Bizionia sp.]